MSAAASSSWTCEYCGRTVPGRITTCYCGRERRKAAPATSAVPRPGTSKRRLLIIGAVAAGLASVAWYFAAGELAVPVPLRPGAPARDASRPIVRPSITDPEAAAPPSDEVIQQALRSVVLVETPESRGTGFFTGADVITTTRHILGKQSSATITTADGRQFEATLAASAERQDLAMLRVAGAPPHDKTLIQAPTRDVRPGQRVVRVSWPQTVTPAVVRGLRRENNGELIELDVPAHADDNGAPILDRTGRVLGVVTTAHTGNPSSGFAIGLDAARPYFH